MRYDVLHDHATLEYQYPSDCFTWCWPGGHLMNISMNFGRGDYVFCWEFCKFNCTWFCSVCHTWHVIFKFSKLLIHQPIYRKLSCDICLWQICDYKPVTQLWEDNLTRRRKNWLKWQLKSPTPTASSKRYRREKNRLVASLSEKVISLVWHFLRALVKSSLMTAVKFKGCYQGKNN